MFEIKAKDKILVIATFTIIFCFCSAAKQNKQGLVTKWLVNDLCIGEPSPIKYALWTMITNSQSLEKYLQNFRNMQCSSFDSIYLLLNNKTVASEYESKSKQEKWSKQIFFIQTQDLNVDNKFLVPPWASEDVFINLEQNVILSCSDLQSMFNQWLDKSVGHFGPIGSYFPQNIIYDYAKDGLQYFYPQKPRSAFNVVSMEISIIPKHLMNLYYADIFQFKQMRKIVQKQQNCQDIALNFMVGLIYDQIPSFIFENYKNAAKLSKKFQQSQSPSNLKTKTDCVYKFFDICGKIPGKQLFTSDQTDIYEFKDFREKPLETLRCNALMKRVLIQQKYFSLDSYYRQITKISLIGSEEKIHKKLKQQNDFLTLNLKEKQRIIAEKKDFLKYNLSYTFSDLVGLNQGSAQAYMKSQKELNESQFAKNVIRLEKLKTQIKNVSYLIRKSKNNSAQFQGKWNEAKQSYQQNIAVVLSLSTILVILVFVAWKMQKNP